VRTGWRSIAPDQMLGMFGEWAREISQAGGHAASELTMGNFFMDLGQKLDVTYTGGALAQVSLADLVRQAMRMRPHRVIVGEIRGPEIVDFLVGANSGHDGSMTTIHASSARDALYKLEMLSQMGDGFDLTFARMLISASVDLIIQLSPSAIGQHRVVEILEVERNATGTNVITTTPLYRWDPRQGFVMVNRPSGQLRERLASNGVVHGG
jgi:pilus assembly protein CpaF